MMFFISLVFAHTPLRLIISQSSNSDIFPYKLTLGKIFSVFLGINTDPLCNVKIAEAV